MNFKKLLAQSIIWRGLYFASVLLVNVFISRFLQASGTGSLYFITIIFSFMQVALSLGMEAGITYFASGNKIPHNKLTPLIAIWSIAAGVIMVMLLKLFFLADNSLPDSLFNSYAFYAICFISGMSFMNFTTVLFYTQENYFLPNIIPAIINLIFVCLIPGKSANPSPVTAQLVTDGFFAVYPVQGLIIYLFFIIRHRLLGPMGLPEKEQIKAFFRYSVTALAANVIFFMVYRIDYLFVKASPVCTNADLGNYIQVAKLGQMLLIVPQIIASVVFPKTAGGLEREKMNRAIMIIARLFSQLFLIIFIAVLLFGNKLFITVFGESFNKMQLPMLILIPGIFCIAVLSLLSAYFSGKGNLKVNVNGALLALMLMVILDWIFVPAYGIIAAATISTICYTANLSFSFWQFYKDYAISWKEFIRWRKEDYTWIFSLLAKDNTTL